MGLDPTKSHDSLHPLNLDQANLNRYNAHSLDVCRSDADTNISLDTMYQYRSHHVLVPGVVVTNCLAPERVDAILLSHIHLLNPSHRHHRLCERLTTGHSLSARRLLDDVHIYASSISMRSFTILSESVV